MLIAFILTLAVGEKGIENKVVYTDGNWDEPSIKQVAVINFNEETLLDQARRILYDYERRGIQCNIENVFRFYNAKDYRCVEFTEKYQQSESTLRGNMRNDRIESDGRRDSDEVKYSRRITEGYNERSDEFRRIQETSRNLSEGELQSYRNGDKKVDAALRGRLSQVYRDAIHASGSRRGNGYDVVVKTEKFTVYKGIEASLFHDTLAPPS